MTSYQRRLRDIEFLQQRGEQLEERCLALARQLGENGLTPKLILGFGICGDRFLNDMSSGDFDMRLMNEADHAMRARSTRNVPRKGGMNIK